MGPGKGSTFLFTIEAPVAELPPSRRRDFVGVQPELQGKRVLVVDDNATNRRVLALQTGKWGMASRDTESPAEALRWLEAGERFDLAILDMHMPEMDGVELARRIRASRADAAAGAVQLARPARGGRRRGAVRRLPGQADAPVAAVRHAGRACSRTTRVAKPAAAPAAKPQIDPAMAARHPLRILLAEDNVVNQKLALRLLQQMGYRADLAVQRHRGGRVGGAPDLRRGADGRADARDGRPRRDAADLRAAGRAASARASSR